MLKIIQPETGPIPASDENAFYSPYPSTTPESGLALSSTGQAIATENGIDLKNGLNLSPGFKTSSGIVLSNGLKLKLGINLSNGIHLSNGALLNVGIASGVAAFAPPAGSDLEKWIDADPAMNIRILRYLGECALAPGKQGVVRYRGTNTPFAGILGLGPSITSSTGLNTADQEKVSSCLLARINHVGEVLTFNFAMPVSGINTVTGAELNTYQGQEAVFFGNLFNSTPKAFMCSQTSWQRGAMRACDVKDGSCSPILKLVTCADTPNQGYCGGQGNSPWVMSSCFSWGGNICSSQQVGEWTHMAQSCNFDGRAWNYPASTYVKRKPPGELCGDDLNCESFSCNWYATPTVCN